MTSCVVQVKRKVGIGGPKRYLNKMVRGVGVRGRWVWLFLGFFSLFALTSSGGYDSGDAVGRYETAKSWLDGRGGALPAQGQFNSAVTGRDGHRYTCYSLLQPALMVPGILLSRAMGLPENLQRLWDRATFMLFVLPALSALALVLAFLALGRLGMGENAATFAVLIAGLATPLWHYARSAQEENLVMLGFALWLFGMAGFVKQKSGSLTWAALGGSLALSARWAAVFPLLPLGIFTGYLIVKHRDRLRTKKTALDLISALLVCTATVGALLTYNAHRFGSPLETGYGLLYRDLGIFSFAPADILAKTLALLFSPYRGLFLFAPVLLLLLIPRAHPRKTWFDWAGVTALAACLALNASYLYWSAGFSWGPRFLVAPLILLVPLFARLYPVFALSGVPAIACRVVLALSVAVQVASVTLPSSLEDTLRENARVAQDNPANAWSCHLTPFCERPGYLARAISNTMFEQKSLNTEFETQSERARLENPDFQTLFWWPFRFALRFSQFSWGIAVALVAVLTAMTAYLFAQALAPQGPRRANP